MNTFAADGTFQLYNPLRRMINGQTIGYDFPFFHGIGVPFFYLPFFELLGGGVFAAEVVKWLISPLIFLVSSYAFFYAFCRDHKRSVIALAILIIAPLGWSNPIWPGNSLIGVRGALPILVAAALLWRTKKILRVKEFSIRGNELVALILLGLSLPFGTEQGVAAILAYALVKFIEIIRNPSPSYLRSTAELLLKGMVIIVVALLSYTILTKGHPFSAIKYAFIDIPIDQGWYFGSDAQGFLTWQNILPGLVSSGMLQLWVTIVLGLIASWILLIKMKKRYLKTPLWFSFYYGLLALLISVTGYYIPNAQFIPLQRMMTLIFIASFVWLLFNSSVWRHKMSARKPITTDQLIIWLSIGVIMVLPIISTYKKVSVIAKDYSIIDTIHQARVARHSDDYFAASLNWKQSIDSLRPYVKPDMTLWSMYAGIYNTTLSNNSKLGLSSGGEDYIIHALGDERRAQYEADFIEKKPHYVITFKPSYFRFEEWLWYNHWKIYNHLFLNYSIVAENSTAYLWEIKPEIKPEAARHDAAIISQHETILPGNSTDDVIVYSVTIEYAVESSLPVGKKLNRYFISINTDQRAQQYRISLPTHKTKWSFPVIVMPGEDRVVLKTQVEGIAPLTDLSVEKVTFSLIPVEVQNTKPLINNTCSIPYHKKHESPDCV